MQLIATFHKWNKPRGPASQRRPRFSKRVAVFRSKLSPRNRLNESRRSESIRAENVFHKYTNWSGKRIERVVERHYASGYQVRKESVQIALGAFIAVITVNP